MSCQKKRFGDVFLQEFSEKRRVIWNIVSSGPKFVQVRDEEGSAS